MRTGVTGFGIKRGVDDADGNDYLLNYLKSIKKQVLAVLMFFLTESLFLIWSIELSGANSF